MEFEVRRDWVTPSVEAPGPGFIPVGEVLEIRTGNDAGPAASATRTGLTHVGKARADARCSGGEILPCISRKDTAGPVPSVRAPVGLPDIERALVSPAAVFTSPDDVVRHPLLSLGCKREILRGWAWDEHLGELALAEGMPEGAPSLLAEVTAALLRLGEEWRPHPAAPAAFVVCLPFDEAALAA